VKALAYMAAQKGRHPQLLQAVMDINADRRPMLVEKVREALGDLTGKTVGLLGLTFKENTDDLRDAPALEIARLLHASGARLKGYDPVGMEGATALAPEIEMAADPYELAAGVDALVVSTPWNEFKQLDLDRIRDAMRRPIIIDGRNLYDPAAMKRLGFQYRGFGRGYAPERTPAGEAVA
jgi:UDPglucose 6-dehydrogenase